jgi:hypothetical protein
MTSFCNEPEQPSRKTIVVERSVFAELVKAAEIGKLSSKAVGSFESERRVLRDSLATLKVKNKSLQQKLDGQISMSWYLLAVAIFFFLVIVLTIFLRKR